MLGRVLVNMIIIPAVILTLSNGIVNKSFANEKLTKRDFPNETLSKWDALIKVKRIKIFWLLY